MFTYLWMTTGDSQQEWIIRCCTLVTFVLSMSSGNLPCSSDTEIYWCVEYVILMLWTANKDVQNGSCKNRSIITRFLVMTSNLQSLFTTEAKTKEKISKVIWSPFSKIWSSVLGELSRYFFPFTALDKRLKWATLHKD